MSEETRDAWPWLPEIVIDRNDGTPPVEQIANAIRNKIATGRILPNDVLPSVRALAASVGTTTATASRTYQALQREGLLTTVAGVGTVAIEFENLQQSARAGMLNAAGQVLDHAMNSLASLGLDEEDLDHLLRERTHRLASQTASLVFVARAHTNLDLYQRQLREMAAGLPVKVRCLDLEALEAQEPDALAAVGSATVVASVITYKRILAPLIPNPEQVHYIITEVIMDGADALLALSPDATVAFVASGTFRTVGLGIMHTYCPSDQILMLTDFDADALRSIPADAVVVHTYRHKQLVDEVLKEHRRICLDFELRSDSLQRLRTYLVECLNAGNAKAVPAAQTGQ